MPANGAAIRATFRVFCCPVAVLTPTPVWSYELQHRPDYLPYGQLAEDCVAGVLYCLERRRGAPRWQVDEPSPERERLKPFAIQEGVLVATQFHRDDDVPYLSGIYRFSTQTGEPLFPERPDTWWGQRRRAADRRALRTVTHYRHETPLALRPGEIVLTSGNIIDIATGQRKGRLDEQSVAWYRSQQGDQARFEREGRLDCGEWGILHSGDPQRPGEATGAGRWPYHGFMTDRAEETVLWSWDAATIPAPPAARLSSALKVVVPFVYLLFYEPTGTRGAFGQPGWFHLATLDLRSGQIVQIVPMNDAPGIDPRLHDADAAGLLVSYDDPASGDDSRPGEERRTILRYFGTYDRSDLGSRTADR
jgi:hypothetical protein